jgi:hypothetical protein
MFYKLLVIGRSPPGIEGLRDDAVCEHLVLLSSWCEDGVSPAVPACNHGIMP